MKDNKATERTDRVCIFVIQTGEVETGGLHLRPTWDAYNNTLSQKLICWASEMAQEVKAPATQSQEWNSVPMMQMVQGEK